MLNKKSKNETNPTRAQRNKKPVRILLSGLGLIGAQHARLIHEREDCELVAVADSGESV